DLPYGSRRLWPDEALEFRLPRRHAMDRLRSAAARGSPADPMLFEQDDVVATLGQMQRRRTARDPPAHDTHVAADRTRERGPIRGGVRGSAVIGIDMRAAAHGRRGPCV